jgi:2-desacetyl-2-hydroxyethyl bacteriochlorophyllide A dehydrogenase
MKAALFTAPHQLEIADLEQPSPGSGEVIVRVAATGICAGDMYIYLGKNPYAHYPLVGGHEIAGEIAELGEGVTHLEIGARVVVEPFIGCGHCYACRHGKPNCCKNLTIIGAHRDGGFAEFVKAPAKNIHAIPDGLSDFHASFAEPVAIAVQALRRGQVVAGEEVLVLGCGPIGLALIEVARAYGAHVVATDVNEARLETARSFGAETLPSDANLLPTILERTDGDGIGVVIEATGNAKVMESTVDLVAAGGRIVIVGLVAKGVNVTLPGLDFTRKEMTIVGSRASANCFPEALRLLESGAMHYPEIATRLPMWDAPRVFAELEAHPGAMHKGVLMID